MAKGKRKYLYWIIIALVLACLLFVIIVFVLTMPSPTLDKRIAEFEAKRKIPDSENAAVIYNKIFESSDRAQLDLVFSSFRDPNLRRPWSSEKYPKAAEWIKNQQGIIDELMKASKFEKCYFPVSYEIQSTINDAKGKYFRDWSLMLTASVNNDIAEGRLDGAIEKNRCILKMSEHLCQQPLVADYIIGLSDELLSLWNIKKIIMDANVTEIQLKTISEFPIEMKDTWKIQLTKLQQAEKLFNEKLKENMTFFERIQMRFWLMQLNIHLRGRLFFDIKDLKNIYFRQLMSRRANRIIIGLRYYKNKDGSWPEKLEEIKPYIKEQDVFIDPQNNGSFVYKRMENGFTLYSKGPNNKDDGGKFGDKADDYVIWP